MRFARTILLICCAVAFCVLVISLALPSFLWISREKYQLTHVRTDNNPVQVTYRIPLWNLGSSPLFINKVTSSCGCSSGEFPGIIPPHSMAFLMAKVDIPAYGSADKTIVFLINSNSFLSKSSTVHLTVHVKDSIRLTRYFLEFSDSSIASERNGGIAISAECPNGYHGPIVKVNVPTGLHWREWSRDLIAVEGRSYEKVIGEFAMDKVIGRETGELVAIVQRTDDPKEQRRITCTWVSVPKVSFTPKGLLLSKTNSSAKCLIRLYEVNDKIDSAKCDSKLLQVAITTSPIGSAIQVNRRDNIEQDRLPLSTEIKITTANGHHANIPVALE